MSDFKYRPEILEGLPDHLTRDLKQYEDWFTLDAPMLKKITDHFVKELEKGLTKEGGNIVSIFSSSWVAYSNTDTAPISQ